MHAWRLLLVALFATIASENTAAQTYYGAPYHDDYLYWSRPKFPSVQADLDAWWAEYQRDWAYAFPGCSYTSQSRPGTDGIFLTLQLKGTCGGGMRIYGTAYSYRPEKNLGPEGCDANVQCGNPINAAIGNKYQEETDIPLAGLLGFVRYYNSHAAARTHLLGHGWTNTYTRSVERSGSGTAQRAIVSRPEGGSVQFDLVGGEWKPDGDVFATLHQMFDAQGAEAGWVYAAKDAREQEFFDRRGRLTEILRANGEFVALVYNNGIVENNARDDLPTRITDQNGRTLEFAYNANLQLASITQGDGAVLTFGYDTSRRLASVQYPGAGEPRRYLYNEPANTSNANLPFALTGIVDETGSRYSTYRYAADGRAVSTEHAGGAERYSVAYGANGNSTITLPDGATQQRAYSTPFGVKKTSSSQESCDDCAGRTKTYTFDANGRYDLVTDERGITTDYDRDARGLLVKKVDAVNVPSSRRTTETDWSPDFRVPTERRILGTDDTLVARSTWTYNSRGQVETASVIDPSTGAARTTVLAYCEQAGVDAGTCPLPGLLLSVDGPRSDVDDVTSYSYYPSDDAGCAATPATCPHRRGDLWKITDAVGHVTENLAYDGAGRVLSTMGSDGVVTDYAYGPRGWLTARKVRGDDGAGVGDAVTSIEYTPTGLVARMTDPAGVWTAYAYDAAHRLVAVSDGAGDRVEYVLDGAGNRVQENTRDAAGALVRTMSRVYDQLGQLRTVADARANPTDFGYDASGNLDTITDAYGHVTDQDRDPLGRLQRTLQDAAGVAAETSFQYDAQDRLVRTTDPKGLSTGYGYDAFGDLVQVDSPDSGNSLYAYDAAGNRVSSLDARGVEARYGYDALRRLTGISYGDAAADVSYRYDTTPEACTATGSFAVGQLTEMTDGSGSTIYCYGRHGMPLLKHQVTHGVVLDVRYSYDAAGRLATMDYPGGTHVAYERNSLGQVSAITVATQGGAVQTLLGNVAYHPFGPPAALTYGDGRTLHRALDLDYRPQRIEDPSPGGLSLGFNFDAAGNMDAVATADGAIVLAGYAYDALGRLSEVKDGPTGTAIERYAYDANGNRLSVANAGLVTSYAYPDDSHRLASVGATTRDYDAAGNTIRIGADTLVYDPSGRLVQYVRNGSLLAEYDYDGKGEQVWWREAVPCEKPRGKDKFPGGGTKKGKDNEKCRKESKGGAQARSMIEETFAIYDQAGRLLGTYGDDGLAMQEVIWLEDLPVGVVDGNGAAARLAYIEPDHLGTPRVVVDPATDKVVWTWALQGEAFGATPPDEDPDADGTPFTLDLRFPGQRHDGASGLAYNYFRNYDASVGRYVESDPFGLVGGTNTYVYSLSAPLTEIDVLGLKSCHLVVTTEHKPWYDKEVAIGDPWRIKWPLLVPSIVQPSPIDLTPNPFKLASGAFPLELPFGLKQIGYGYIERQRYLMQRIHPETDHYKEICTDDCGRSAPSGYTHDIDYSYKEVLFEFSRWTRSQYYADDYQPPEY